MIVPFFLRSIVDRIVAAERQRDHLEPKAFELITGRVEPPAFDTTSMPVELDLPARPRDPATVQLITVHVTDVEGGFGVSRQQLAKWTRLVSLGKVPSELEAQRGDRDASDWAYTLALLERYSRCAYHRIVSRRVGIVVNHPLSLRTSHGNGGNVGAGWAIDCSHKESIGDAFASVACESLEDLILDCHEASGAQVVIVPHRVYSKKRSVDTDSTVWREVVRPAADVISQMYGDKTCRIGYEIVDGGSPITTEWDERALYDPRGRRL